MSKVKTKKVPFDTEATEVSPQVWHWTPGGSSGTGQKWQWANKMGLNTGPLDEQGEVVEMVYLKTLTEAALFSEGFVAGFNNGFDLANTAYEKK